jgi:hypothetical protein
MSTAERVFSEYDDALAKDNGIIGPATERFVDEAVARHGIPVLVAQVVRSTESGDPSSIRGALGFIREVSRRGNFREELVAAFREALTSSGFFEALERCLHAPTFEIRMLAAFTFGQLFFPETAERLVRAFDARYEASPFVRAEACHLVPSLERRIRRAQMSRAEKVATRAEDKLEKKRIDALAPKITFERLYFEFNWGESRKRSYTMEDVYAFLEPFR